MTHSAKSRYSVTRSFMLLATSVLAGTVSSAGALAQTSQTGGSAVFSGLDEIVVTARKRSESLQDVPAAVAAFSSEMLERRNLTSLEAVAAASPSLVITRASTGSGAQLSMRGVGSNFTSIGIEQSVAVILDGAYYGQGRVINEGMFDVERIEVLKGPQALFFGKNATAGVISIETADPTEELEVMARVGYEFRSQNLVGEAVGSGPLSDKLGLRVAARGSNMFDGYFTNRAGPGVYTTLDTATGNINQNPADPAAHDQPGEEALQGRVTLKWDITEQLDLTLKAYGSRNRTDGSGWNNVPLCGGDTFFINATPCERDFAIYQHNLPQNITDSDVKGGKDGSLYGAYDSYAFNAELNYQFDNASITSITNYNYNKHAMLSDYSYEAAANNWATEHSKWRAFSNETRVLTEFDSPINVLLGVYYQKTEREFEQRPIFGGIENSATTPEQRYLATLKVSNTDGETISGFGQVIWDVTPDVELTAGVRYTHETKESDFTQVYSNPLFTAVFIPGVTIVADQTFNAWSPEATLSWAVDENVVLYGAYKTGYKSGGFSNSSVYGVNTVPGGLAFGPEKAKGFEAGVKTTLFDEQLRLNLIGYHYKYEGLQVDFFDGIAVAYVTMNAGASKSRGIELEGQWAPRQVEGLSFHGSVNYNKSTYSDFQGPCYGGQSIAAGCTLTGPGGAFFQNLNGVSTANAPRWTATLGTVFETMVTSDLLFGVSVDGRYSDNYFASAFGSPVSVQSSYITLDASARVRTADDQWELALIGKNLTNRFIVTGAYDITGTGSGTGTTTGVLGDQAGSIALPRTVQLQLTWRY